MKTLKNKKVYVGKHSREIQEKAFELGWVWGENDREINYLNSPFLYFNDNIIGQSSDMGYFNDHAYEEITAEEILEMEVPLKIGDTVMAWGMDEDVFVIGILSEVDADDHMIRPLPYLVGESWFQNAKKVTKEEVIKLLKL